MGLSLSAHASTLVTDGGFESAGGGNAYYAGSSIDGGAWNVTAGAVYIDSGDPYVYDGSNSLNLTGINPYTSNAVSQTLSTVKGGTYTVSFYADADSANQFEATANGIQIAGLPISIVENGFADPTTNSSQFVEYTGTFYASSANTTLSFIDLANPPIGSSVGSVVLDDVNVAFTPEPGSFVLLLTGLAGTGAAGLRRRLA
jgi:hypothetical protein